MSPFALNNSYMLVISWTHNSAASWLFEICLCSFGFMQTGRYFSHRYLAFLKVSFYYSTTDNGNSLTHRNVFNERLNSMILFILLFSQALSTAQIQNSILTLIHMCPASCLQRCGYYHVLESAHNFSRYCVSCHAAWNSPLFYQVGVYLAWGKSASRGHIPWSLAYFVGLVGYGTHSDLSNDDMRYCIPRNFLQVLRIAALLRKIHSSRHSSRMSLRSFLALPACLFFQIYVSAIIQWEDVISTTAGYALNFEEPKQARIQFFCGDFTSTAVYHMHFGWCNISICIADQNITV